VVGLGACLVVGCAAVPPPRVLGRADRAAESPSALEAKALASGAFAHAEKKRREAYEAFDDDRLAEAQVLGEHAVAAYAHAHVLSRVVRASQMLAKAEDDLAVANTELAGLDADQSREKAALDALELQVRVLRDAEPLLDPGKASPAREKARREAARALALQARLLCGAATMLTSAGAKGAKPKAKTVADAASKLAAELTTAQTALDVLDEKLAGPKPTPIDEALSLRATCLSVLTRVRRARTPVSSSPGTGDALLSELSAMKKHAPSRDDRGVVVTLRGVFDGEGLSPSGKEALTELGRVAAAHPDFPVAVVLHQARPAKKGSQALWRARGLAMVEALGVPGARSTVAGDALPVVSPTGKDKSRNERVEVVFVTPETF